MWDYLIRTPPPFALSGAHVGKRPRLPGIMLLVCQPRLPHLLGGGGISGGLTLRQPSLRNTLNHFLLAHSSTYLLFSANVNQTVKQGPLKENGLLTT